MVLSDPKLIRKLKPRVRIGEEWLRLYSPGHRVPEDHTEFSVITESETGTVATPAPLEKVVRDGSGRVEVAFLLDARWETLVSVLKAAHLTMFYLRGYEYALGKPGRVIGRAFGGFFVDYRNRHAAARRAIPDYFRSFEALVRPILEFPGDLQSTVRIGVPDACSYGGMPFGYLVYVRVGHLAQCAVLPMSIEGPPGDIFREFALGHIKRFEVHRGVKHGSRWAFAPTGAPVAWPESGISDRLDL